MTPLSPQSDPAASRSKSNFIDEQTKSLLALGFIKPVDMVFAVILLFGLLGGLAWVAVARPPVEYIVLLFAAAILLCSVWTVILSYRATYFVLSMRAIMETLPEESAKIQADLYLKSLAAKPAAPMPG